MYTQTYIHTYSNTCICTFYVHTHALTYVCIYVFISSWRIRIFLGRRRLYIRKYMAHSCNKTKVARLTFVIEIWIHICTHSKHVHVTGSCNKTKVARLTFLIGRYMVIYIQSISQWQESTAPLLSCYSCVSYAYMHVVAYASMYICIHISMTRVNCATFVLLQSSLI